VTGSRGGDGGPLHPRPPRLRVALTPLAHRRKLGCLRAAAPAPHRAGLTRATYTTSTWTYATRADRWWWAELWEERITASALPEQAVNYGIATEAELAAVAGSWREWATEPDGVFVVVHGEVVARA
jgi:hypothetical protein